MLEDVEGHVSLYLYKLLKNYKGTTYHHPRFSIWGKNPLGFLVFHVCVSLYTIETTRAIINKFAHTISCLFLAIIDILVYPHALPHVSPTRGALVTSLS